MHNIFLMEGGINNLDLILSIILMLQELQLE